MWNSSSSSKLLFSFQYPLPLVFCSNLISKKTALWSAVKACILKDFLIENSGFGEAKKKSNRLLQFVLLS